MQVSRLEMKSYVNIYDKLFNEKAEIYIAAQPEIKLTRCLK